VNIRKESTQKHYIDERRKAREIQVRCRIDHTATRQALVHMNLNINKINKGL